MRRIGACCVAAAPFRNPPGQSRNCRVVAGSCLNSNGVQPLGDLDAECARLLKKVESAQSKTDVIQLSNGFDRQRRELLPGTVLAREWAGQARRVMVVQDGFAFEGKTYDSLSKIAFAITGTKWNGPRFFGLRGNSSAAVPE